MKIRSTTRIFCIALLPALAAFGAEPAVTGATPATADVAPAQPVIPDHTFNLMNFGAVADAKASNTEAFQHAITAVNQAGGGTLIVPAGIYLTDAIDLCSGINLHLNAGATILFSPSGVRVEGGRGFRPPLEAKDAHDVMISGSGTINGSGEAWWPAVHEHMHHRDVHAPGRPHSMVSFVNCQRVRVEGVTLTYSPSFNLVPTNCQDVTIDGITIYNPADDIPRAEGNSPAEIWKELEKEWDDEAPNTDGIDPAVSQRVLITHCTIDTGDDCIAIKANAGAITRDILITDCTFLHGHGLTIGSGTRGGVRNMTVRRCTFDGTWVGVSLRGARDRGGLVEDVTFSDLTMKNVGDAILATSYYPDIGALFYRFPYVKRFSLDIANGAHDKLQPITATTPCWKGITIRNVTATCVWEAGLILGLPEMPDENFVLDNVTIEAPEGLRIAYTKDIALHNVHINAKHGPPLIVSDTVEGLTQQ